MRIGEGGQPFCGSFADCAVEWVEMWDLGDK